MKAGKLAFLVMAGFMIFMFGIVGTWYALAGDWVNTRMSPSDQMMSKLELVGALWLAISVVLIGAYSGAQDSGWELPTYETFDGRMPPFPIGSQYMTDTTAAVPESRRRNRKRIQETESFDEASQVLESESFHERTSKPSDKGDRDHSYRGELPKRKRSGYDK